jgi:hypothetical protein
LDRGRDGHTALCQTLLLIWERWTDGNLAMRRMLECESADLRSHEERCRILMEAITQLMVRGSVDASSRAAIHAGLAALAVVSGEEGAGLDELVRIAWQADAEAQARQPRA